MSFRNFSRSPFDNLCIRFQLNNVTNSSTAVYQVTVAVSVVTALLAPMAVAGNAFMLAAIWRNPSLRTPSYVLLAGLAVTDFCTGLLSQPFFVMFNLAAITGKEKMFCIGGIVTGSTGPYFSALTFAVVSMMAVERWLHMSRRSLLTVRRVLFLYATFAVLIIFPVLFTGRSIGNVLIVIFFSVGVVCIAAVALAYLKVFQIIRHHQHQIHTNANAIDMKKYKNSIFTILYILMLFVFSYVPYMYYVLVCFILQDFGKCTGATFNVCVAVMFSCSCFNPLLYYWRIKEIRDGVRSVIRKIFYKQNEEASS